MKNALAPFRKAAAALVVGAAGLFGTAMSDGDLTGPEAIAALGGALVLTAAVYGFKNAKG